jgi:hypothetical protein
MAAPRGRRAGPMPYVGVVALLEELRPAAPPPPPASIPTDAGPGGLVLLAATLSLAAAAIHFAFAPEHFAEYTSHGVFFLVSGGLQAGWAVLLLSSRSLQWRRALLSLGLLNVGVIAVWVVSRTVGIPASAGAEAVGFPDVLATVCEAGIVVLAAAALLGRPRDRDLRRPVALGLSAVVGAAALVSLTPRYAGAHADHAAHAGHAAAGPAGGHADHAAAAPWAAGTSPCENSGAPVSPAQVTDAEGHFHRGPQAQQPLDAATRVALAQQQVQARAAAARYPTVADAERAGYRMSTPYVPCIGAHFTNLLLVVRFEPSTPSELLYDGTTPDSKLVGLSYLVYHPGGAPDGFAGPNDVWHQHNANGGLCFNRAGVVIAGEDATPQQCAALGGSKRELTDVWMLHDWVAPGWECSWGVFAPECPELGGRTGGSAWD